MRVSLSFIGLTLAFLGGKIAYTWFDRGEEFVPAFLLALAAIVSATFFLLQLRKAWKDFHEERQLSKELGASLEWHERQKKIQKNDFDGPSRGH